MSDLNTSRRTIVKGAAWAVPAISVAAAAPSLAASSLTYTNVTKDFTYEVLGQDINVQVTAIDVPADVHPGEALKPIQVTSTVTIPASLANAMRSIFLGGADQVSGTSKSVSDLDGAYVGTSTTDLTIPMTPFVDGTDLVLVATGTGLPLTIPAGTAPGIVTITMGSPSSLLTGYDASGAPNGRTYTSNLAKQDGNDYTLATFTIH